MINPVSSPVPSLTSLVYLLFRYISKHPLIISPPVFHPLTGERVYIQRYKLFNGIELQQGLSCSIFPHYQDGVTPPEPNTTNVSAIYEPHDLGTQSQDRAVYHLVVKFHYANSILGNKVEDPYLIQIPVEAVTHPDQILLTSAATKAIDLYINPGSDIIGNYLEILRLVIEDNTHKRAYYPLIDIKSFEVSFVNLKSVPWEQKKEIYFHEGEALIRMDAFISRGWRDNFFSTIKNINLLSDDTPPKPPLTNMENNQC